MSLYTDVYFILKQNFVFRYNLVNRIINNGDFSYALIMYGVRQLCLFHFVIRGMKNYHLILRL